MHKWPWRQHSPVSNHVLARPESPWLFNYSRKMNKAIFRSPLSDRTRSHPDTKNFNFTTMPALSTLP